MHPAPDLTHVRTRLFIVEDEDLYRAGLRLILDAQPDLTVVGEAASGAAAVAALQRLDVDVVLLDIRLGALDGLEVARRLAAAGRPARRILVLTTFDLDEYVEDALAIGAGGFVLKSSSPEDLVAAVRAVARGEAFLTPSVTRRVIDAFSRRRQRLARRPRELDSLTRREHDVLTQVTRGLSNREIGRRLRISESTVRTHVAHLLMKLNLRDRTQAAVLGSEAGVLDDQ